MNKDCHLFINYILHEAPTGDKATVEADAYAHFKLTKDRSVYHNQHFAVRFSSTKDKSFSNTILALSQLKKYDRIPFFVVIVRRDATNLIWLANSSLLKKVSHSSKGLTMNHIVGSFNGSDIIKSYDNITNEPNNFDTLFALHEGQSWEENLQRLVENTSHIKPTSTKFIPSSEEADYIRQASERAAAFVKSSAYDELYADLRERCERCQNEIAIVSHNNNVNERGRLIEAFITANEEERAALIKDMRNIKERLPFYTTRNDLGDYVRTFENGTAYTDIKTKVMYLSSSPKAYNIDKFLECMAESDSVFMFFFIGFNEDGLFGTRLCSVFHKTILEATILQYHWAGRSTRGTAQLNGKAINTILNDEDFTNIIEPEAANEFLDKLLER